MASKVTVILSIFLINLSICTTTTTPKHTSTTTTDLPNEIPTFPPNGNTRTATGTTTTEVQTIGTGSTGSNPHYDNTTNTTNEEDVKHGEGEHENGHSSIELVPIHFTHVKYPLVFTIVVLLAGLSKLGFHFSHFLSSKIPESCILIILGIIFGIVLYFTDVSSEITLYQPHEFFLFLLPPIILEASFSLHDRTFAENIGSVLLFAVVGTVVACFTIGVSLWGLHKTGAMSEINCTFIQILVFSALIVAVDPVAVLAVFQEVGVNDQLYFMVFGESLLNDGVTVVLYNVLQIFNRMDDFGAAEVFLGIAKFFIVVICGVLIGIICGLVSSFITKYTNSVKVVEPLIIFGFAYLSYVLSELFQFSGIISMVACGVLQVHYAFHNITNKSRMAVKFFAKVMATACEIVIFLFLGIVTIDQHHDWNTGFTLWTVFLCIMWRMIIVYTLSFSINYFDSGRVRKIKLDEMFMIGGTIKWLVKKLRISLASQDKEMNLNEELSNHVVDHLMAGIEEIVGYTHGNHHIKEKLDHIDDNIIRPKLLRNATSTELEGISHYYEKLVMKEHYKQLHLAGAKIPRVKTEIRHLDSELALDQLVQDPREYESHRRHESYVHRREEEHRTDNESHGHNVHKFLTHTFHSVRSRLHLKVHDKNMVHDHKHHLITYLRRKHKKNKQLSLIRRVRDEHHIIPSTAKLPQFDERNTSQVKFHLHDEVIDEDHAKKDEEKEDGSENGRVVFHI